MLRSFVAPGVLHRYGGYTSALQAISCSHCQSANASCSYATAPARTLAAERRRLKYVRAPWSARFIWLLDTLSANVHHVHLTFDSYRSTSSHALNIRKGSTFPTYTPNPRHGCLCKQSPSEALRHLVPNICSGHHTLSVLLPISLPILRASLRLSKIGGKHVSFSLKKTPFLMFAKARPSEAHQPRANRYPRQRVSQRVLLGLRLTISFKVPSCPSCSSHWCRDSFPIARLISDQKFYWDDCSR